MPRSSFQAGLYLALSLAVVLTGTISFPGSASAGIFKCVAADGSVTYSQRECEDSEKTAKILSNNGRSSPKLDCSVADSFIQTTITKMRDGVSSGDLFTEFGGMDTLSNFSLGAINYVYSYQGNLTTTTERVKELTMQKCAVGSFGVPSCYALPATLINQDGGCNREPATAAAKPQKTSSQSRQPTQSRQTRQSRPSRQSSQRAASRTTQQTSSSEARQKNNLNRSKADLERERRRAQRRALRERNRQAGPANPR